MLKFLKELNQRINMTNPVTLEKIVSLCKQRGFVFPSSEIYGGMNGLYDFGPLGSLLKNNLKNFWISEMQKFEEGFFLMDGAILSHPRVWEVSGHVSNFSDPLVDCLNCKRRFRTDDVDLDKPCHICGIKNWTESRQFMLMFQTQLGAMSDSSAVAYLRPETAQMVFVNFKNVMTSSRAKLPFGIGQIGKAFRNEITPKQFLFRMREFEQMELEFFCLPIDSDKYFDIWLTRRRDFYESLGIKPENLRFRAHLKEELAHYSKNCTDVEYQFPFGWKELEGIAHRSDFDLGNHQRESGKDLSVFLDSEGVKVVPHVVECSIGVDRLFCTVLFDAYTEEKLEDGDVRVVLKLNPKIAPIKVAVLPLMKKFEGPCRDIYRSLKAAGISVEYDDSGSIGKRYRRQDEIGTPFCITFDYQSLDDEQVTVRFRDSLQQVRIRIETIIEFLRKEI